MPYLMITRKKAKEDRKIQVEEMEVEGAEAPVDPNPSLITVQVQFGGRKLPVSLSPDSTINDLKSLLQPLTNVLPRGQKLISKGKVLENTKSLKSLNVKDGAKIMLVASQGLHQGEGPIAGRTISTSSGVQHHGANQFQVSKPATNRLDQWKITGVVALSESQLKAVPQEVWDCELRVRVLDLNINFIQEVPSRIGSLKHLKKLLLDANDISDDKISWDGLSSLKSLAVLSLNKNNLTTLPSAVGTLTSLSHLHIANNKLTCLPDELGSLNQLQILKVNNNRISSVPSSVGNCCSLIEIDLSCNLLVELPQSFGNLQSLKALYLSNNGLKSLPSTLFKKCTQLSTLDIHGTQITNDVLRQADGWEDFDERRLSKHQKQLDFHVGSSGVFDEGADDDNRP